MKKMILALVLTASGAVRAQTPPPTPPPEPLVSVSNGKWGVVGALTAPANANVVEAGLGWPGIHASFLHGLTHQLELGGRFTFNYGVEGLLGYNTIAPGLKLQFLARFKFFDNGKVSLAARFEPGLLVYFYPSSGVITCNADQFGNVVCGRATSAVGGLTIPMGVRLGIVASSALNVGVSFDLPIWFSFGRTAIVYVPVLMGVGVEYFLQSNLLLAFNIKMGPTLTSSAGSAVFTLESKIGVGYRF